VLAGSNPCYTIDAALKRTFSPEDRPDRLAGLIGGFVQENLATRV
jgi:hypothetical protein